jgi:hypothetical protein
MRPRLALTACVLIIAISSCRCGPKKPPAAAQQRVDELLDRSESPVFGPREPLDEIKRNFEPHRDILRRELELPEDLRDVGPERAKRIFGAMVILGYVGTREAGDVIIESLRRPLDYLKKAWRYPPVDGKVPPLEESMSSMLYLGLVHLGAMRHPGLIDEAISILGTPPVPHRVARVNWLQYLTQAGRDDPTVVARLRKLLDDKSSPLYGDHHLKLAVESLENPKDPSGGP